MHVEAQEAEVQCPYCGKSWDAETLETEGQNRYTQHAIRASGHPVSTKAEAVDDHPHLTFRYGGGGGGDGGDDEQPTDESDGSVDMSDDRRTGPGGSVLTATTLATDGGTDTDDDSGGVGDECPVCGHDRLKPVTSGRKIRGKTLDGDERTIRTEDGDQQCTRCGAVTDGEVTLR